MLGEIAEGARARTGAQLGIASTVDRAVTPAHYVFSGFSEAAQREVLERPEGLRFVEHLHEAPGPLRVEDWGREQKALALSLAGRGARRGTRAALGTERGARSRRTDGWQGAMAMASNRDGKA